MLCSGLSPYSLVLVVGCVYVAVFFVTYGTCSLFLTCSCSACVSSKVKLTVSNTAVGAYRLILTVGCAACMSAGVLTLGANAVCKLVVFLGNVSSAAAYVLLFVLSCCCSPCCFACVVSSVLFAVLGITLFAYRFIRTGGGTACMLTSVLTF